MLGATTMPFVGRGGFAQRQVGAQANELVAGDARAPVDKGGTPVFGIQEHQRTFGQTRADRFELHDHPAEGTVTAGNPLMQQRQCPTAPSLGYPGQGRKTLTDRDGLGVRDFRGLVFHGAIRQRDRRQPGPSRVVSGQHDTPCDGELPQIHFQQGPAVGPPVLQSFVETRPAPAKNRRQTEFCERVDRVSQQDGIGQFKQRIPSRPQVVIHVSTKPVEFVKVRLGRQSGYVHASIICR